MSTPCILVTEPVPPILAGLQSYETIHLWEAADPAALVATHAARIQAIAVGPKAKVNRQMIEALPALELIAKFGAGYENVDALAAADRGVIVTHTPDAVAEEVADFALGLLLGLVRDIPRADRFVREGAWTPGKFFPLTASLRGRKVGIVGLGRIGAAIARRCAGFGLSVAYCDPREKPKTALAYFATPQALAAEVDILFVSVAGGGDTKGLIDAQTLDALGPEGLIVNVGRGTVVDQTALIAALTDGRLRGAALDVYEDEPNVPAELIAMEQVILTPHCGGGSLPAVLGMARQVVENIDSWFAGEGPRNPVPETPWSADRGQADVAAGAA